MRPAVHPSPLSGFWRLAFLHGSLLHEEEAEQQRAALALSDVLDRTSAASPLCEVRLGCCSACLLLLSCAVRLGELPRSPDPFYHKIALHKADLVTWQG